MDEQQQSADSSARRRLYFIGAAIGAVMLVIIVVLAILLLVRSSSSSGGHVTHGCALSDTVPNVDVLLAEKKNIAAPGLSSLANMIGYIYVYDAGFMPIILSELIDDVGLKLTLKSECATIYVQYNTESDTERPTKINLVAINLSLPDLVVNGTQQSCQIPSNIISYSFQSDTRFACTSRLQQICRADEDQNDYGKPVAELVLESLEFELLADGTIRNDQFNRQPQAGGCSVFT